MSRHSPLLSLLLALPLAACGPAEGPTARASVADDPAVATGSGAAAVAAQGAAGAALGGSVSGTVQVQLSTDGHAWVDASPVSTAALQLQVAGEGAALGEPVMLPVGTYGHARLHISPGVELRLSGTVDGAPVAGTTVVSGPEPITIERRITPVTVRADADVQVVWDLNAEAWLAPIAQQNRTAARAALQEAATVRVVLAEP